MLQSFKDKLNAPVSQSKKMPLGKTPSEFIPIGFREVVFNTAMGFYTWGELEWL